MPPFGPITRRKVIQTRQTAGFTGPFPGSKHQVMLRGEQSLRIPNPHQGDIGRNLLRKILREANISRDEWERL